MCSGFFHRFRLAELKTVCNAIACRRPSSLICNMALYRQHGEHSIVYNVEKWAGLIKRRHALPMCALATQGTTQKSDWRLEVEGARFEIDKQRLQIDGGRVRFGPSSGRWPPSIVGPNLIHLFILRAGIVLRGRCRLSGYRWAQ